MHISKIFFIMIAFSYASKSIASSYSQDEMPAIVQKLADSTLNYVLANQGSGDGKVFKGEWVNFIYQNKIKIPGRKETKYLDSNIFVTASIYDILADIYEFDKIKHEKILPHLDLAINSFEHYQSNKTFNFWPMLPKKIKIESFEQFENINMSEFKKQDLGHRPSYFPLRSMFEINFTNIVNDADDTALAYRAIHRHQRISLFKNSFIEKSELEKDVEIIFDKYRDTDRYNNHFYNSFVGNVRNTNAFLTWFGKEANIFNFSTKAIPINKNSNIPFGVNDVDCVVNANILNTLAVTNRLEFSDGHEASCDLIKNAFAKHKSKVCGIYYPSEFTLHYTTSNAIKNGVSCLSDLRETIINEIIREQKDDGSFISKWHNSDTIQSTAYGLNSLINLINEDNKKLILPVIEKGIRYLVSAAKVDKDGNYYYNGGAFFSGGTVIRKKLIWVSDSYTTALVSLIFFNYPKIMGLKN